MVVGVYVVCSNVEQKMCSCIFRLLPSCHLVPYEIIRDGWKEKWPRQWCVYFIRVPFFNINIETVL